jgi:putative transposase
MKKNKLSEAQIMNLIKESEAGVPVADLCRKYEVANSTLYKLKAKYGGMELSDLKRLKALEDENRRLKQMYADMSLEHRILKDVIEKKFPGLRDAD